MNDRFPIPILFIVFNRPELTSIVYKKIEQIRPKSLFVAADGPRNKINGEHHKCSRVRQLFNKIDRGCEFHKLFRDENLGCKRNVSSAITWFFENVDEGIILEDDCLPDMTFFRFCKELLDFYRYNDRIMMISGVNFQFGKNNNEESYYFSRYSHVWGWATWKDRWKLYDDGISKWAEIDQRKFLNRLINDKREVAYWSRIFNKVYDGKIDTWDYQLLFASWINNRLSVIPNNNLISNIGFGCAATHTKNMSPFANIETSAMEFPLKHPRVIERHVAADEFTSTKQYRRFIFKKLTIFLRNKVQRLIAL